MSRIDEILEQCLRELASGDSSLEECLARHPEHAAQLEPLLRTASRIEAGAGIRPSPMFKARARAKLTLHMKAHPRHAARSGFDLRRLAAGFAALLLALLVTGTVYAQGALPGDALYGWKLASERAWRVFSPDAVDTDIRIANRRIDELNATADDPERREQALDGYREVVTRLESELDDQTLKQILPPVDPLEDPDLATPAPTSNGNGNGNDKDKDKDKDKNPHGKDPKSTPPVPTKKPKFIPTIEVPPPRD